jgi:hypothetical protein
VTVAIDPGEHVSGVAVFLGARFAAAGRLEDLTESRARDLLERLEAAGHAPGPRSSWHVAIEAWTNPNNMAAIQSLAYARRTWQAACRVAGVPDGRVCLVNAATWQAAMLGRGYKALGGTKAAARAVATTYAGRATVADLSDDECDAVCLGAWLVQAGGVEGFRDREAARKVRKKGTAATRADAAALFRARGVLR